MAHTLSRLLTENQLEQSDDGLWIVPGTEQQPFAYSDGDDAENYVYDVIANAQDTSSTSSELESHIRDWPSEYHFTSKRATLLRALDLSAMEHVLELGCGCGAISRYLGEQGMQVDAIEGSTRRAQIARSRCRDLDNVSIVNANYNDLALPDEEYDAIFLIGVLEYARRFCPDATDDLAAVHDILVAIKKSIKPDGVLITAIENRLGLKYLLGATEDHYAVPYIGIDEYPDSAGIRTYDYSEWQNILDDAGFLIREFLAPFPDYKLPSVVLHEKFLATPEVVSHLYAMTSRDYYRVHITGAEEGMFWKGFQQSGCLKEFVNSYLIVTAKEGDRPAQTANCDFVHVSGPHRKLCYRTITRKLRNDTVVSTSRLADIKGDSNVLEQVLVEEAHLQGSLLSEVWLHTLLIWQDMDRLTRLFSEYYAYLQAYSKANNPACDMFDILPFNIIVDSEGVYQPFDREWLLKEKATPEYVLFRGLFWFVYGNSQKFAGLFKEHGFESIQDFVSNSFTALDLDLGKHLEEYIELEDRMHVAIGESVQPDLTRTLLNSAPAGDRGRNTFESKIYWAQQGKPYAESNSLEKRVSLGKVRQQITFDLPAMVRKIKRIRFDPTDREGYFHIYSLKVVELDTEQREARILVQYDSGTDLVQAAKLEGLVLHGSGSRAVFLSTGRDPWLGVVLPENDKPLRLIVEMDWPHSEEYEIVRAELKHLNDEWQWEKLKLNEEISELKRKCAVSDSNQQTWSRTLLTKMLGKAKRKK